MVSQIEIAIPSGAREQSLTDLEPGHSPSGHDVRHLRSVRVKLTEQIRSPRDDIIGPLTLSRSQFKAHRLKQVLARCSIDVETESTPGISTSIYVRQQMNARNTGSLIVLLGRQQWHASSLSLKWLRDLEEIVVN